MKCTGAGFDKRSLHPRRKSALEVYRDPFLAHGTVPDLQRLHVVEAQLHQIAPSRCRLGTAAGRRIGGVGLSGLMANVQPPEVDIPLILQFLAGGLRYLGGFGPGGLFPGGCRVEFHLVESGTGDQHRQAAI